MQKKSLIVRKRITQEERVIILEFIQGYLSAILGQKHISWVQCTKVQSSVPTLLIRVSLTAEAQDVNGWQFSCKRWADVFWSCKENLIMVSFLSHREFTWNLSLDDIGVFCVWTRNMLNHNLPNLVLFVKWFLIKYVQNRTERESSLE